MHPRSLAISWFSDQLRLREEVAVATGGEVLSTPVICGLIISEFATLVPASPIKTQLSPEVPSEVLLHRHQVRKHLGGVEVVRQAVPDRRSTAQAPPPASGL